MNFRAFALGLVFLSITRAGLHADDLSAQQQEWLRAAERHERAGWIYLHVEGGPRERGFQHGYLLAKEIAECLRVVRAHWLHESSMEWSWLVTHTKGFIEPGIDSENRAELQGIVEGMKAAGVATTFDDLVTYNAELELEWYWWPVAAKKLTDNIDVVKTPRQSCSSFIATGHMTKDGGIVLGHNTMDDYVEALANIVIDLKPAAGHRILMQTQPGWIHSGTDFFITDAGLVGSETTIGGFKHFSEKGVPEFIRMRRATQDAASIDQWCVLMKKGNNGGYANAWLVGDVNSGEIARLEIGLKYIGFEHTNDGFFLGSNIAEDLHILRMETDTRDDDIRLSNVARRVRWKQLMKENAGKIDLALGEKMEGDCYDTCLSRENPSSRTLSGHFELDSESMAPGSGDVPFHPNGSFDAKVVDSRMAKAMSFAARWGSADGSAFDAPAFLAAHPQYDWLEGYLKSLPSEPWVEFKSGEGP
ncbi:MAG TPA: C45 family autoproteolytic acyltransferase/hydrolase [Candidatus Cybelea sp.]|nr:C45 family autoproteolytic acyltransferase/hydrolase [Candidatus Cybelea sp.]